MQAASEGYANGPVLYMAMELSAKKWKIAFGASGRQRLVTVDAGQRQELLKEIGKAKIKFSLPENTPVKSLYEAGRDGFWIHRWLISVGVQNLVVDAASIEVPRRARRVKTDRVDAQKLLDLLRRHWEERSSLSVVRVPDEAAEDARRWHRERGRLMHERIAHESRIASLLNTQGVQVALKGGFIERLATIRGWDGRTLGAALQRELVREWERLEHVRRQLRVLEHERQVEFQRQATEAAQGKAEAMYRLRQLRAIGDQGAWLLVREVFGWRRFRNRRELAGYSGLTPTPYDSGGKTSEQGISKAGNRRVRALMVELSWCWLRYQPRSELSRWFRRRFASGSSRARRVGLVALARRLLIALWRYVEYGELPHGAQLKTRA